MHFGILVGTFPKINETFILNQMIAFMSQGHELTIYALHQKGESVQKISEIDPEFRIIERVQIAPTRPKSQLLAGLKGLGLLLHRLAVNPVVIARAARICRHPKTFIQFIYRLSSFKRKPKIDALICHFGQLGLVGHVLQNAGLVNALLVVSFHGFDINVLPGKWGRNMYQQLFDSPTLLTVGTIFMREKLVGLGANPDRTIIMPMGIDFSQFDYAPIPIVEGMPLHLLSVGRLTEVKGYAYAVEAVGLLKQAGINFRYTIVGDGELRQQLERKVTRLGLRDAVTFAGFKGTRELKQLLQSAHIFLAPGIRAADGAEEGQGVALIEAQACGLFVIGTRTGGIPEVVAPGNHDWLVEERSPDAIARAIRTILDQPDKWDSVLRESRQYVEDHFDLAKLTKGLVEIIKSGVG